MERHLAEGESIKTPGAVNSGDEGPRECELARAWLERNTSMYSQIYSVHLDATSRVLHQRGEVAAIPKPGNCRKYAHRKESN